MATPVAEPVTFPTASQASTSTTMPKKGKLSFSDVASLFIRLRRFSARVGVAPDPASDAESAQVISGSTSPRTERSPPPVIVSSPSTYATHGRIKIRRRTESSSPVASPHAMRPSKVKILKPNKPHHTSSTSGSEPKTHPSLQGAVLQDVALVGISEDIQNNNYNAFGAQAIEWVDIFECSGGINPKTLLLHTRRRLLEYANDFGATVLTQEQWQVTVCGPKNGIYRAQIRYTAVPKRSTRPDPGCPVSLDQAKPPIGLMVVLKKNDF